ncbi:MAG TPA: glycosyltransferase family 2 protein [Candidatus Omnitrophota bacterium]|nr:glycosyltransferase family 2 protein [Candidatus Omnitrophota bacterium]HRZ14501.1 glycosyltransferase family 2 protein [Candidatus Omnitrophota bacterium]
MALEKSTLVSVVVLNLNGCELLKVCLAALVSQTYQPVEIIVVDNGSQDDSVDVLKKEYPQIRIIENKRNLGYAPAANIGIKQARGEYIAVLNNDTRCDLDWLQKLMDIMATDERIGSCSSKQMNFFQPEIIDSAGIQLHRGGFPLNRGRGQKDTGQFSTVEPVLGAAGASALYRRRMLEEAGLFDEVFFAYNEEFDLALRQLLCGWKCMFVPDATVYHMSGATRAKKDQRFLVYYMERNRIFTLIKDFPWPVIRENFLFLLKYEWDIFLRVLRFEFAPLRARLAALKYIPAMIKKRKVIQSRKKIGAEEFRRWIMH